MILRAALALALVGCGGGASTLKLTAPTPVVDEAWTVDRKTHTKNKVTTDDGIVVESAVSEHERSERKVVIVEGTLIVRLAARYEIDETTETGIEGAQVVVPGPLAGKHYEVWRNADAIEAQHADGSPITAAERSELNREFATLGTTTKFDELVLARAWTEGEVVEIPRDVALEIPGVPDDADIQEATIAWTGGDGDVVTLRATLALRSADGFDARGTGDLRFHRRTGRRMGSVTSMLVSGRLGDANIEQQIEIVETIE